MNWLTTPEGRRAAAFGAMTGGAMAMTIYAAFALWIVRGNPEYAFGLGLAAHIAVMIVLSGFVGLLIKRTIKASAGVASFESTDSPDAPIATVTTQTTVETKP